MDKDTQTTIRHYDLLIEENNDPFFDPQPLKEYMDKWDGQTFVEKMQIDKSTSVLEIGVGTGRIAVKVIPHCRIFYGIDLSPKTIQRAKENLSAYRNALFFCDDFQTHTFDQKFNVIYSSLTFMHIKNKREAIEKVANLLTENGRFILSIDKNQKEYIDYGTRKIKIFPDNPQDIKAHLKHSGLIILEEYETELAHIFVCVKNS